MMESNFTLNHAETKIRIAIYPRCITELREVFPTLEKALRNHVLNLQIRPKTDLLETHAIQMKIVLTKIAIMEFAKQNASLMRTVASSNHVQWEAIFFIQNVFRLRMRERTVTKRWPTPAVLWLCAMKENVFDSFPFL